MGQIEIATRYLLPLIDESMQPNHFLADRARHCRGSRNLSEPLQGIVDIVASKRAAPDGDDRAGRDVARGRGLGLGWRLPYQSGSRTVR
jgi:hypothetical protein